MRRSFVVSVKLNGRKIDEIQIDPHFEKKHSKTVNDFIIIALVKSLDGSEHKPDAVGKDGFEYFVKDPILLHDKPYRLVWLLHPKETYVGILNCFRRSK